MSISKREDVAMTREPARPVPRPPRSRGEWVLEALAVAAVLASLAMVIYYWPVLPESVPRHFDAAGKPVAWSGKGSLFLWPAIGLVAYGVLTRLSRSLRNFAFPWPITEENAPRQYRLARTTLVWIKTVTVVHFALVEWRTVQVALGKAGGIGAGNVPLLFTVMLAGVLYFYHRASKER